MFDSVTTEADAASDRRSGTSVFPAQENIAKVDTSGEASLDGFQQIKNACAECKAYGGGEGFFGRKFDDRVLRLLLPAYKGLVLVADDPDRLAVAVRHSDLKTTKATLKNPALIFVKMGARPQDTAQDKLCSSWAEILNEARTAKVSVEGFVAWVKERSARRERPGTADKRAAPMGTQDANQLKLRLTGADGPIDEILVLPPAVYSALTEAMTAPVPRSERVQRLADSLHAFASELKANEASMDGAGKDAVAEAIQT